MWAPLPVQLLGLRDNGVEDLVIVAELPLVGRLRPEALIVGRDDAGARSTRLPAARSDEVAAATRESEDLVPVLGPRAARALRRTDGRGAEQALALEAGEDTVGDETVPVEAGVDEGPAGDDAKDTQRLEDQSLAVLTGDGHGVRVTIPTAAGSGRPRPPEAADGGIPGDLGHRRGAVASAGAGHLDGTTAVTGAGRPGRGGTGSWRRTRR